MSGGKVINLTSKRHQSGSVAADSSNDEYCKFTSSYIHSYLYKIAITIKGGVVKTITDVYQSPHQILTRSQFNDMLASIEIVHGGAAGEVFLFSYMGLGFSDA